MLRPLAFLSFALSSSLIGCKAPPATAYDRACEADADCVPLRQDCGCVTGAIAKHEAGHAEFDFLVHALPIFWMEDCATVPDNICLHPNAICVENRCTTDGPASRF